MKKIGIDPDNKFIGCALLDDNKLFITKYSIPEFIYDVLPLWAKEYEELCKQHKYGDLMIYLEGGWLNNYYYHSTENWLVVNNIARKIGMNHQVGITIEECMKHLGLKFETVKPVQNSRFKPSKEKISHLQLKKMIDTFGIEFQNDRSNQDERDSALLLLHYTFEYVNKNNDFVLLQNMK